MDMNIKCMYVEFVSLWLFGYLKEGMIYEIDIYMVIFILVYGL